MIGGSLFSGIEGFGLGLIWSGLVTSLAFQVEIDPFCRRVLEARFPDVDRSVSDVRLASARSLRPVDLIFFGSPCQDLSGAGEGEGLEGERSGLFYEGLRVVEELKPQVVLFENVASGARRWVCPVRGAFEALGYRTRAYHIGVDDCGGPHRRKRLFILAYAHSEALRIEPGRRRATEQDFDSPEPEGRRESVADPERSGRHERAGACEKCSGSAEPPNGRHVADAAGARREGPRSSAHEERARSADERGMRGSDVESDLGSCTARLPPLVVRWPAGPGPQEAWEPPRVAANVPERAAKLRAIGNAVSPIQAYYVGLWARSVLEETRQ